MPIQFTEVSFWTGIPHSRLFPFSVAALQYILYNFLYNFTAELYVNNFDTGL